MKKTKWVKEKPWSGPIHQGCLNCPPVLNVCPLDAMIAVGFGAAIVTKDEETVYSEDSWPRDKEFPTLAHFERKAKKDPDHDWRVILEAPLRSREYQRQGPKKWVLIKSGMGFA